MNKAAGLLKLQPGVSTLRSARAFWFQAILFSLEAGEVTKIHVWEGEGRLLRFGAGRAGGAR